MRSQEQAKEEERERELLTIDEVAEILAVSPVTIYRYKKEAGLPYIKIGKILRFDKEDLWDWIQQHKIKPSKSSYGSEP